MLPGRNHFGYRFLGRYLDPTGLVSKAEDESNSESVRIAEPIRLYGSLSLLYLHVEFQ